MVLFYFSGHGVQHNGDNFLLGIDAGNIIQNNVNDRALNAQQLIQSIARTDPYMIIFILDCCRNYSNTTYPYNSSRGFRCGLAAMQIPKTRSTNTNPASSVKTVIAFSCAENEEAGDESRHGPYGTYTYHLIPHILRKDTDVVKILEDVAEAVKRDTNSGQKPYVHANFKDA
ncbi:unnamed protein product, partial [Rotaria sp. Silwood1]